LAERRPTIDCQACGKTLKFLTMAEAQQVAARPYDFVIYCMDRECQEMALAESRREGLLA
jgi:hypothetical protein